MCAVYLEAAHFLLLGDVQFGFVMDVRIFF